MVRGGLHISKHDSQSWGDRRFQLGSDQIFQNEESPRIIYFVTCGQGGIYISKYVVLADHFSGDQIRRDSSPRNQIGGLLLSLRLSVSRQDQDQTVGKSVSERGTVLTEKHRLNSNVVPACTAIATLKVCTPACCWPQRSYRGNLGWPRWTWRTSKRSRWMISVFG